MPFISTSSGIVICRSTSSAAWPGHCVTICTCGGDRSGYASIGRFWNDDDAPDREAEHRDDDHEALRQRERDDAVNHEVLGGIRATCRSLLANCRKRLPCDDDAIARP